MVAEILFSWNWGTVRHVPNIVFASGLVDDFGLRPRHDGEDQIADELAAYNPLIPQGRELVATVMFEVDDEARRRTFLAKLGGIEETAFLRFGGERVAGVPEADVDRTTTEGKASAVQFIHLPFTDDQVEKFRSAGTEVVMGFDHSQYSHMAVMSDAVRTALAEDFD